MMRKRSCFSLANQTHYSLRSSALNSSLQLSSFSFAVMSSLETLSMSSTSLDCNSIGADAAALIENASKRRRLGSPQSEVLDLVMESPITMATRSPVTMSTRSPVTMATLTNGPSSPPTEQARLMSMDTSCKTEQIALLTALSQVVSCTQEAVKILRETQEKSLDLEHKRFRFQLEAEEKRLMMESEHYRKMETMFSGLIQAVSQTPVATVTTPVPETQLPEKRTSPNTVKLEMDE